MVKINPKSKIWFLTRIGKDIALCGYPIAKMEIKDSSQISTTAPIFLYYNYFRQNIWVNILVHFHFQYIFVDSTTNNIRFNSRPCSRCWCYPSLSPIKEKFHKCPISNQRIAGWEWKADLSVSIWNTIIYQGTFIFLHTRTNRHNQPSLQFENNEDVVGLGVQLNAESKNTF